LDCDPNGGGCGHHPSDHIPGEGCAALIGPDEQFTELIDQDTSPMRDVADLLSEVLRDSAIPRDWWLRVMALDLLLKLVNDGNTITPAERDHQLKQIERYIQTGEWS
jgi:hypothetical protein